MFTLHSIKTDQAGILITAFLLSVILLFLLYKYLSPQPINYL